VYVPAATDHGRPILVETYYPYGLVEEAAGEIRSQLVPWLVAFVLVFALVQIPPSIALALRLQRNRQARAALLSRLLSVSDTERRRVAGEIHDGAVQDLIGLGYALGGMAERAPATESGQLRELSRDLSDVIARLRQLLTSIYPTALGTGDVGAVVETFASGLRQRGIAVAVDVDLATPMDHAEEAVVLRTVNELLCNVEKHSGATTVSVHLERVRGALRLDVADDGSGFDWDPAGPSHAPGHFGLRMIADLARDSGGSLTIARRPERGTIARLELPSER
jgi:two-component system, NarL family, sensor kinase